MRCPICEERYGGNVQTLDRSIQRATLQHMAGKITAYEMHKVIEDKTNADKKWMRESIEFEVSVKMHGACPKCKTIQRKLNERNR